MSTPPPPRIFSRPRRIAAFDRTVRRQAKSGAARFVLDEMLEDVGERLNFMRHSPRNALVVGDWSGSLAQSLRASGANVREADVRTFDEEQPWPGEGYDLIVSLNSLAQVNDLPGALLHARAALAPNGVFMASVLGSGSLTTLRHAIIAAEPDRPAGRLHPLVDTQAASALLQRAGFRRQVVDSHTLTVTYGNLLRLVSDLRDQALGNTLTDQAPPLGRAALERAEAVFRQNADAAGRVAERFEILMLTAWAD